MSRLLKLNAIIPQLGHGVRGVSGTVLWSVLLLGSSETEITHFVLLAKEGTCHA